MIIYIAGPYTKPDPVINVRTAIFAGRELRLNGFLPFVPHLFHLWHTIYPQDMEYWMKMDLEWLEMSNAVLRLPGESVGADREVIYARTNNIKVFTSFEALYKQYPQCPQ